MEIGKIIKCDVCGRQIVKYACSNEYVVGPRKLVIMTDIRVHICHEYQKDPLV